MKNFCVQWRAGVFHRAVSAVGIVPGHHAGACPYLYHSLNRAAIGFAADGIVREDGPTRYNSLIHLRGNVEIRTCCTQPPGRSQTGPRAYMIIRADEADYDGEKGQIEARGTVRVSFQDHK